MVIRILIGLAATAFLILGGYFGYRINTESKSGDLVSLTVSNVVPASGMVQEGESIAVQLNLQNHLSWPIEIKNLTASCGCMNFRLAGKEYSVGESFTMKGDSSVVIDLNVGTSGTSGIRGYRVGIHYEDVNGRLFELTKHLEFRILGQLRVEPPSLTITNAEVGRVEKLQLYLADGQLGDGIEIREVRVSCPERLSTSVDRLEPSPLGDGRIRRSVINVNYFPLEDEVDLREDFIELVPADSEFSRVQIPIVCYMKPSGLVLTPDQLYVSDQELPVRRAVTCQSYLEYESQLVVVSKPDFVTVEIEPVDQKKSLLNVCVALPDSKELQSPVSEFQIVLGDSADRSRTWNLNVYISRSTDR
jgi:hypothetical protein